MSILKLNKVQQEGLQGSHLDAGGGDFPILPGPYPLPIFWKFVSIVVWKTYEIPRLLFLDPRCAKNVNETPGLILYAFCIQNPTFLLHFTVNCSIF